MDIKRPLETYMKKIYNVLLVFLFMPNVSIAGGWHFWAKALDKQAEFHRRFPEVFHDDITNNQKIEDIELTADQKQQAQIWELTQNQEKRYVLLMQNRSGIYYQNKPLTPVEILGINARTDEERMQYARLAAKQEAIKIAKELAFNSAYHKAYIALMKEKQLPVIRPFNETKYSPFNYQPINLHSKDKLMLFVHLNDSVLQIVSSLLSSIKKDSTIQLNIYFVGEHITKTAITDWAKKHDISTVVVKHKLVTLNFGNRRYEGLKDSSSHTPALYLIRDGQMKVVDTGRF